MDALLRMRDVDLGYGRSVVLPSLSFELRSGVFIGLVGPNGAGKTTLLRTLLGLAAPLRGKVEQTPGLSFGYVPQRGALDPIFPLTVEEIVLMGLYPRLPRLGRLPEEIGLAVERALETCGIAPLASRSFRALSGGQRQRVLIARALVAEPDVFVLDEPTNDMDIGGEHEIMQLLSKLHRSGKTILMVSHLLNVLLSHVEELAVVQDGKLEQGARDEFLDAERLGRLFGLSLRVERLGERVLVVPEPREVQDA